MRTDLDHLPANKQRELERVKQIIFEEFEDALALATNKWKKKGRIEKLILYGSYARGGWVDEPHTAKGYRSDFDLLIIVNDKRLTERVDYWLKLEDRLIRELAIDRTLHTPVNFIVHTLQEVNDGLAHGRYFFMDVAKDGIALHEADDRELHTPKPAPYFFATSRRDATGDALFDLYRERRLAAMPLAPLLALLSSNEHKHAAYRALAVRNIDDFAGKLRADVKGSFSSYFSKHWPDGIKTEPTSILGGLGLGNTDPNELKRRELMRAALDTICARRDDADLALVRQALDANNMAPSETVIGYLAALGDESDIGRLSLTSQFNWPRMIFDDINAEFKLAARTILKLSKGKLNAALRLDIPDAMRTQLLKLASWPELASLSDEEILQLLLSDDMTLKRSAARQFAAALPRRRISKILKSYRASPGGIYYIITHWLDLGLGLSQRMARAVVARSE